MLFSSCAKKTDDAPEFVATPASNEKYKMSDLPASAYYLGDDTICFFPYDNKIYKAGNEIGVFDIESNMAYTKLCEIPDGEAYSMYVTADGIFLYGGSSVSQIGFDGILLNKYALPEHDGKARHKKICVTEKYIAATCLLESEDYYGNCLWVIDLASDETNKLNITDKSVFSTNFFEPGRKSNEVVLIKEDPENSKVLEPKYAAYTLNLESGKLEKTTTFVEHVYYGDYIAEENMMYFMTSQGSVKSNRVTFNRCTPGSDEVVEYNYAQIDKIYKNVKTAVLRAGADLKYMYYLLNDIFVTGYDVYMWDSKNKTMIVNDLAKEPGGETLTVIYPKVYMDFLLNDIGENGIYDSGLDELYAELSVRFEEEYNVKVAANSIDIKQFNDRMRMKFLAGEDDFDIVYHDNVNHMLAQILNYQLYMPLEGYEKIVSAYDNDYIEGVKNLMSWDGHIYGVPHRIDASSFAVNEAVETAGIPVPDESFTLDDFWSICETAYNMDGDCPPVTLEKNIFFYGLENIIEDAAKNGGLEKADVADFIENYLKYKENGILTGEVNQPMLLDSKMSVFITNGVNYGSSNMGDFIDMRAVPSPSGKQYCDVRSMVYANRLTKKPDLCADYLALLMSREFASLATDHKTMLWQNPSDYHTRTFNGGENSNDTPSENAYTWVESPIFLSARETFMLKYAPNVLGNAAPRLYSYMLDEILYEICDALKQGTMTVDEAAEKLCSEVNYRMLE